MTCKDDRGSNTSTAARSRDRWEKSIDDVLSRAYARGDDIGDIAYILDRTTDAVRSRVAQLRLRRGKGRVKPVLVTAGEVAEMLGLPSRGAVYKMVERGQIKGVRRIGARRLRFEKQAVEAMIDRS